ncbi:hypothetical protein GCM10010302_74830 [Streptomyces polychromogenes]|uniref:Uncharacterized protein n=1 Tax=Streptomyces polychromogenes TaxID=67342 RepID=A0ABP3FUM9_9ACTN
MLAATTTDAGHAVFKVGLDLLLRDLVTGQERELGRRRAGLLWDHPVLAASCGPSWVPDR